jgi:hypothetical protein
MAERLQLKKPVAAAGAAEEDRGLVPDAGLNIDAIPIMFGIIAIALLDVWKARRAKS